MRVTCGNCQAGYTVPDDKLKAGRRLQFNCRHCNERVVVHPQAASPSASAAVAPAVTSREPRWFVANADGSYQKLAESEVHSLVAAGALAGETLVWRKGFGEWAPAAETEPWAGLLASRSKEVSAPAPRPAPARRGARISSGARNVGVSSAAAAAPARKPRPIRQNDRPEPSIRPSSSAGPGGTRRRRRKTDRGLAAPGPDAEATSSAVEERSQVSVVGAAAPHNGQQAVSLPIVRPKRGSSAATKARPAATAAAAAAAGDRFAPSAQPQGTPMDGNDGNDPTDWAPATDTYIGPRDKFTRRLGSEAQRDALLEQVDRETRLRRDLQRWQWVALGTACVAIVSLSLAIFAFMAQREAEGTAAACFAASGVTPSSNKPSDSSAEGAPKDAEPASPSAEAEQNSGGAKSGLDDPDLAED